MSEENRCTCAPRVRQTCNYKCCSSMGASPTVCVAKGHAARSVLTGPHSVQQEHCWSSSLDGSLHEPLPCLLFLTKQTMDLCQGFCIDRAKVLCKTRSGPPRFEWEFSVSTSLTNSQSSIVSPNTLQWNPSIKDILNKGHLSNEDTVCCPNHIELCTNLPLN